MSKRIATVSATGLLFLWIVTAVVSPIVADEGWSMSSLNPFKKKAPASERVRGSYSDEPAKPSTPSWPSLPRPTSNKSYAAKKKPEPSTLDKMSQGTKSFFGKSKDVLMPWTKSPKKPVSSNVRKPPKKSYFSLSSWFPQKKKPKESKTINDFLSQDRPGF